MSESNKLIIRFVIAGSIWGLFCGVVEKGLTYGSIQYVLASVSVVFVIALIMNSGFKSLKND